MKKKVVSLVKWLLQFFFRQSFLLGKSDTDGIIISFDDGPHPDHTEKILNTLDERGVKAVFFVTGEELAKHHDLGMMIVNRGHLLGNHTYSHQDVKQCTFREYKESMQQANELIHSLSSSRGKQLFRPPFSSFSLMQLLYIFIADYYLVNWTIDSRDSFIVTKDELIEYVMKLKIRSGDILLFHEDYPHSVAALPEILDFLHNAGHRFVLPPVPVIPQAAH